MRSVTEIIASNAGMKPFACGSGLAANGVKTANPRSKTTAPASANRVCRGVGGR